MTSALFDLAWVGVALACAGALLHASGAHLIGLMLQGVGCLFMLIYMSGRTGLAVNKAVVAVGWTAMAALLLWPILLLLKYVKRNYIPVAAWLIMALAVPLLAVTLRELTRKGAASAERTQLSTGMAGIIVAAYGALFDVLRWTRPYSFMLTWDMYWIDDLPPYFGGAMQAAGGVFMSASCILGLRYGEVEDWRRGFGAAAAAAGLATLAAFLVAPALGASGWPLNAALLLATGWLIAATALLFGASGPRA